MQPTEFQVCHGHHSIEELAGVFPYVLDTGRFFDATIDGLSPREQAEQFLRDRMEYYVGTGDGFPMACRYVGTYANTPTFWLIRRLDQQEV